MSLLEPTDKQCPFLYQRRIIRLDELCVSHVIRLAIVGSFSNNNGDGNENVTNMHIQWAKTIALGALHVRFSFLSISLPLSAKLQREITEFEVLWRTSFFSPKLSSARNGFIPEGLPHL